MGVAGGKEIKRMEIFPEAAKTGKSNKIQKNQVPANFGYYVRIYFHERPNMVSMHDFYLSPCLQVYG